MVEVLKWHRRAAQMAERPCCDNDLMSESKVDRVAFLIAAADPSAELLRECARALAEISAASPPDDWEWYEGCGDYMGYGEREDAAYVAAPDISNSGDMHSHGWACGQWGIAKQLRPLLARLAEAGVKP